MLTQEKSECPSHRVTRDVSPVNIILNPDRKGQGLGTEKYKPVRGITLVLLTSSLLCRLL